MELILQPSLPHQQAGVDAVADVFVGIDIRPAAMPYANPVITITKDGVGRNIADIQRRNGIRPEYCGYHHDVHCFNIDVKMETGTGKTYVYARTMYELHRRYGINKFIVAVPTLPIKAGARQFMEDGYTRRHFRDECGYDAEIELLTLEPPRKKKKGRQSFPEAVAEFVKGSNRDGRKIYVLLVNMQLLKVAKNYMLSRDDYGCEVQGFYRPFDALRATRPFVIIDEPHKFARDQKAFGVIRDEIAPQCIIRYGATFPETVSGRGKNKTLAHDYQNLLYDLNACEAFNQGLIKGVAKEHFEPASKKEEKIKLLSVAKNDEAVLQHKSVGNPTRTYRLKVGDSLSVISEALSGITLQAIGRNAIELSNGQTKTVGEEMSVDIYMQPYQEQMLRLALKRHFETERENFCGRTFKIKTLALFFIDDITAYRRGDGGKTPYLLETFERLLKEKLVATISELGEEEAEYREFLEESLNHIGDCHGGYFAQDNSSADEDIADEVNDILNGKKQLLAFRDGSGKFVLRRFLFSKWTLKEGWDNPNVFTIAKLRSSGSETSKLQEVGRGLRLPVDECGNRISNREFMLNYIVDFTEADFADKLVAQINSEVPSTVSISLEQLKLVAQKMGKEDKELFIELLEKKYVDLDYTIVPQNRARFFEEYPLFRSGLGAKKVTNRNKEAEKPVGIRKARFAELEELWKVLNQRYIIWYDAALYADVEKGLSEILESNSVFSEQVISSRRAVVRSDGKQMGVETGVGVQYAIANRMPYGTFLKRVSLATNIPVPTIHRVLCCHAKKHGNIKDEYFNEQAIGAIVRGFHDWKVRNLQGRFIYKKTCGQPVATALTHSDGTVRENIAQGRIGIKIEEGSPMEKYLYDAKAYDSPLELENINDAIDEVIVYGKIPRNSVAIPTITGESYSPDFMYVVKRSNGEKELNVVVETKGVENESTLRGIEEAKIKCAEVFFNNLSAQGYNVCFRTQLGNKKMLQIVKEILH